MPVSKKRKKKQRRPSGPPPPKKKVAPKKKLSKQKIAIYIISGLMILSLAIGFIASGTRSQAVQSNPAPQSQSTDGDNLLVDPPSSDASQSQSTEEDNAASETSE